MSILQLWDQQVVDTHKSNKVTIQKVTEENAQEALEVECSIQEFGGKAVREKAFLKEFSHPAFSYYLLKYEGNACSSACIFKHGTQAQLESVATLNEYRGKGLIGLLIRHIQQEVYNMGVENLWVFPIDERVEKVYQKYGFKRLTK